MFFIILLLSVFLSAFARTDVSKTPPMGFMKWNFYADKITENDIRNIADTMV